jgi:hypothetical protein
MKEYKADIILEIEDLLSYNNLTHDIKVDKNIFDNFKEKETIYIHFVEDEEGCIREYRMDSEDEEGIYMDYICEYID